MIVSERYAGSLGCNCLSVVGIWLLLACELLLKSQIFYMNLGYKLSLVLGSFNFLLLGENLFFKLD